MSILMKDWTQKPGVRMPGFFMAVLAWGPSWGIFPLTEMQRDAAVETEDAWKTGLVSWLCQRGFWKTVLIFLFREKRGGADLFRDIGQMAGEGNGEAEKLIKILASDLSFALGNFITVLHPDSVVMEEWPESWEKHF